MVSILLCSLFYQKLFGHKLADFHVDIDCVWNKDGSFEEISNIVETKAAGLASAKGQLLIYFHNMW